ncbi:LacI family DNA-binding transcriptional regulator [uncultured Cohaesibacter sp.]|uniref:LacI family DNA-binding transcriptional regulator n=1 Tax=uncultured Cohaesibacter sp. TaxID=1002546 RepID=UPI002930C63C|nr:LacI family DNA-binding transcriptional regulator [uncultured Cohaesibacter sp.]
MKRSNRKVSIKDVAFRAGVANSTVSHVLNGTASISSEVRARVLTAAKELGYLAKREMKATISVLDTILLAVNEEALPASESNLFSWTILNALSNSCKTRGVKLVPSPAAGTLEPRQIVETAKAAEADGIIIINEDNSPFLEAVRSSGIPAVLINGEDQEMHMDSVAPGNRFAAKQATNWLISHGHQKIMHLTWNGRMTISRRLDGFLDAVDDHGIAREKAPIVRLEGYDQQFAEDAIYRWLDEHGGMDGVTAVFAASDNLAIGTMKALTARGLSVPDDVSVMGFDGVSLGELVHPPLSTVRVPLEQIGPAALILLEQRILDNNENRAAHRLELGCSIIARDSVATLATAQKSTDEASPDCGSQNQ